MAAPLLGFLALFFLLAVGGSLVLYVLVRDEHDRRETMDRETAERTARRDGTDDH
ncbi:MAG: hypothetical protein ABEJ84_00440 [Halodesulfurarchaeum sp.]